MQIMVFLLENMSCNIMSFYKKRNWNLAKTKSSYPHARNEDPEFQKDGQIEHHIIHVKHFNMIFLSISPSSSKSHPFANPNSTLSNPSQAIYLLTFRLLGRFVGWSTSSLWYTSLESVLESSWDFLHVAHTTGTGGLSSLGLLTPVVCSKVFILAYIRNIANHPIPS